LRILVISNLYPPLHLGGYELGCADIVDALRARRHEVTVLTSRYGVEAPCVEGNVHRLLWFQPALISNSRFRALRRERDDQRALVQLVTVVKPEVIFAFSFYRISAALLLAAQRHCPPVTYAFSAEWLEPGCGHDPWLGFWRGEAATPLKRFVKRVARRLLDPVVSTGLVPLDIRHAYFTSGRLRELYLAKGLPVQDAEVIPWGVDLERFRPEVQPGEDSALRLLFAGRIAKEKGLHTAIEALTLLQNGPECPEVRLTVAGPTQEADYLAFLRRRIEACGLAPRVHFLGAIPREAMPQLYRSHDALLFPSIWEEPFSIGLLEAMASGLAVVGTTTGGSREVLREGVNALTFPPGDAPALAHQVRALCDPALRQRLGREARRNVEERFSMDRMVDRVEAFLWTASRSGTRSCATLHADRRDPGVNG
jgi:glycosyltransferase involved in cell wall biosynthesis